MITGEYYSSSHLYHSLVKQRTKGGPKIDKNKSFCQLGQVTRIQRIKKAMKNHQATKEANSFTLQLDDELVTL